MSVRNSGQLAGSISPAVDLINFQLSLAGSQIKYLHWLHVKSRSSQTPTKPELPSWEAACITVEAELVTVDNLVVVEAIEAFTDVSREAEAVAGNSPVVTKAVAVSYKAESALPLCPLWGCSCSVL